MRPIKSALIVAGGTCCTLFLDGMVNAFSSSTNLLLCPAGNLAERRQRPHAKLLLLDPLASAPATCVGASKSSFDFDNSRGTDVGSSSKLLREMGRMAVSTLLMATFSLSMGSVSAFAGSADDLGATSYGNAKIMTGGASTMQSGRTIAITRGVNLDKSDFRGQNLKGVAFQQSIVRDADFRGANLVGASFFDATLDGSNFENADMTMANVEMAQFRRANLKNTVVKEMYVSGATLFDGIENIEGSDWSDTFLRADQKKYLCEHPTSKGTNPVTGVDTRESLMCD